MWALRLLVVYLAVSMSGCGADTSVEMPAEPAPPPTSPPQGGLGGPGTQGGPSPQAASSAQAPAVPSVD